MQRKTKRSLSSQRKDKIEKPESQKEQPDLKSEQSGSSETEVSVSDESWDSDIDHIEDSDDLTVKPGASQAETSSMGSKSSQKQPQNRLQSADAELSESELSDIADEGGVRLPPKFDPLDSSDEEDIRNTIGNIPYNTWYKDYEHIGYDWTGARVKKRGQQRGEIDEFLAKMDDPDYWRRVKDRQLGGELKLTDEQIDVASNVRKGKHPVVGYNPYEPWVDLYSHEVLQMPAVDRQDHKKSFIPSLPDKKKVSKLVYAIRMGWLKPKPSRAVVQRADDDEMDLNKDVPKFYDLWSDGPKDQHASRSERARSSMRIGAPKLPPPGHAESYNPPSEYLRDAGDTSGDFVPQKFDALRQVPAYGQFVAERFERCLDLYLAPRQKKNLLDVRPADLLPELPAPRDLRPFPTIQSLVYRGHKSAVRAIDFEPHTGQYMASVSDDGCVRLWEVATTRCQSQTGSGTAPRCVRTVHVACQLKDSDKESVDGENVGAASLSWCPAKGLSLILAAFGNRLVLLSARVGDRLVVQNTENLHKQIADAIDQGIGADLAQWRLPSARERDNGIVAFVERQKPVRQACWHSGGDYFASVCPAQGSRAVLVHQLSRAASQAPFSKSKGTVQCVLFHHTQPQLFVATQTHVRIYDLSKLQLHKKLYTSPLRWAAHMSLHPGGDNLLVTGLDCRAVWFDLDWGAKPFKSMRHHKAAARAGHFHGHLPLFATVGDDACALVYHGMVYNDLSKNPLIVPVKVLRGHKVVQGVSILDVKWHPTQPWLATCGADKTIRLFSY